MPRTRTSSDAHDDPVAVDRDAAGVVPVRTDDELDQIGQREPFHRRSRQCGVDARQRLIRPERMALNSRIDTDERSVVFGNRLDDRQRVSSPWWSSSSTAKRSAASVLQMLLDLSPELAVGLPQALSRLRCFDLRARPRRVGDLRAWDMKTVATRRARLRRRSEARKRRGDATTVATVKDGCGDRHDDAGELPP